MRKKKIAIIIEKLSDRGGGAERVLVDVANSLESRGHTVEVITHEYRGKPPAFELNSGIIISNLRPNQRGRVKKIIQPARKALNLLHSVPLIDYVSWQNRNGAFWRRLGKHLSATKPDVAIAFMPPAITALAYARVDYDLMRIASTHNSPEQDYENKSRWDPSRLDRIRRLKAMDGIDKICVLLPEYATYYSCPADKVVVMPNAVKPMARIVPPHDREPIIVASGRLERVKRHDLSLMAWKKIQDKFPNWSLQIFGEGSMRRELEILISVNGIKRAYLMGHYKDVIDRVGSASVMLHPATFEGFPLAVCEALAAGTPVIGFRDCSGLNSLVKDNENGILVAPESRIDNLSGSLENLISSSELRNRLSKAGPPSVYPYTPELVTDSWEKLLYKCN